SQPAVREEVDVLEPEGRVLAALGAAAGGLVAVATGRRRVPFRVGRRRRRRRRQHEHCRRRRQRRLGHDVLDGEGGVPHEEVERDGAERVAVQRQLLAERHRVEALDVAGGGHHPGEHLLAADARHHQQPRRPARGAVELQEPRPRRRHAGRALLRHRRHVNEPFLGAADGEPQPRVPREQLDLQRRLAGHRRVPQPHGAHDADVHAVVVLEPVQAGVRHVGEVGQRAHVHRRQRHLAGDLGEQRLRLDVHEGDGDAGGLRRHQPRVGAGEGVLQRLVPGVRPVGGLGQQQHRQEAARRRHRQQLLHLLLPRERFVSVADLRVAQRRQHLGILGSFIKDQTIKHLFLIITISISSYA
ncbi:Os09g0281850, partial [Oryza sativa Japonica Group]